jgi:hypothetical protein
MSDVVNKPGQWGIYKKSAAAQLSLILPTYNDKGWLVKAGGVLMEATKSVGKDDNGNILYDWTQKVTLLLAMNDIALLYGNIEAKIVHEYQNSVKNFSLKPGTGDYTGTWQMMFYVKDSEGGIKNAVVPMTAGEFEVFGRLLDRAAIKSLGW